MAVPNTFSPNTRIESAKVNENFDSLADTTAWDADILAGWLPMGATLTYASASSFTTSVDLSAYIVPGTKFRFKQGGSFKYYYCSSISGTTINVDVNTDYVVANAAITDPWYSNAETPVGFPYEFNWNWGPTNWTIGTGGSAGTVSRYRRVGKMIFGEVTTTLGSSGQSVGTNVTFVAPVSCRTGFLGPDNIFTCGVAHLQDLATASYFGTVRFNGGVTTLQVIVNNVAGTYETGSGIASTVPHTWAAGDGMTIQFAYPAG